MIFLSLAAKIYLIMLSTRLSMSDTVCPYSWQWNEDKTMCVINCDGQSESSKPNINCLLSSTIDSDYDSTNNVYKFAPGKSLGTTKGLPYCYNVTLTSNEYNVTSDDQIQLNYNIPPIDRYNLDNGNNLSITTCYPLSPQLQQCDLVQTHPDDYQIENGTTLTIPSRNITTYLGDFVIDETGLAYTCSQGVNVPLYAYPRCNYVTMSSQDYVLENNGAMFILKANFTIKNPVYSNVMNDHVLVCIPLSIRYLDCPIKLAWQPYDYTINPDLSATNLQLHKTFTVDNYFLKLDDLLVLCLDAGDDQTNPMIIKMYTIQIILSAISSICLTIVFFVKIKSYRSNYHTKCLLCHIGCLIVAYLSLTSKHFISHWNAVSCYTLYVFLYFSYMGAFFWLNVIAYDSWRTFSRMQISPYRCYSLIQRFEITNDRNRFICYNLYAWGMALLLTVITLIVEFAPMPHDVMFLNPQIGYFCWFNNTASNAVFYYFPLGLLMALNLIFFILTIYIIRHASTGTEMVNYDRKKQTYEIAIKLFVVMGLCWTVEVISYSLTKFETYYFKFWFISNTITCIQGILIFIVYFSKKDMLKRHCNPVYMKYRRWREKRNGDDGIKIMYMTSHNDRSSSGITLSTMC